MAYELVDFADIYTAVMEELKLQTSDTVNLNRIKRMVNTAYIQEVIPAARWFWLYGNTVVTHKNYYAGGTASVTPNSSTITLSTAPATTDGDSGSFLGWNFSIEGKNEIYKVTAHTAEATTMTIDRPFNNELNATASFKLWNDIIALPTDLRETIECWHDHLRSPMEAKGTQEHRRIEASNPKAEGRPVYYSTYNYTSGDESTRYRQLRVYPSISTYKTLIKIDYIKEATSLDVAGDEPLMPVEDRIVLFYGALALAWGSIGRNPEEAARCRALFEGKLARMMGKIQDSQDKPRIEPDSAYIRAKKGPRIFGRKGSVGAGGASSYTAPSYLENVTINAATITGNVTVNSGITIDGRDISADAALNDAHIAASGNVHGITGSVVGTSDSQTLTNKTIVATSNTITALADANVDAAAAITRSKLADGTAYRILANTSAGVMSENAALTAARLVQSDANGQLESSVITATELTYLDDVEALTSFALADNQAAAANVATWTVASFDSISLNYSIKRDTAYERGTINIVSDGTNAAIAQSAASIGSNGITFTVDVDAGLLRLRYTSTNTGSAGTLKYKLQKWQS